MGGTRCRDKDRVNCVMLHSISLEKVFLLCSVLRRVVPDLTAV